MIVAPSILASNKETRVDECARLYSYGARYIHIDIMDGKFVPATTFGPEVVEELKVGCPKLFRDVHLMVERPDIVAPSFIAKGAQSITFHYEAFARNEECFATIDSLHGQGVQVGMSIKPATDPEVLLPFLGKLDLVLVMSVEPGKGGQAFMEEALPKISFYAKTKKERGYGYAIEVDGGINGQTGLLCKEAGAEILVAGSYLFGKDDQKERVEALL